VWRGSALAATGALTLAACSQRPASSARRSSPHPVVRTEPGSETPAGRNCAASQWVGRSGPAVPKPADCSRRAHQLRR